jgi:hypothetical protein
MPLLLPSTSSAGKGAETLVVLRIHDGEGLSVFDHPDPFAIGACCERLLVLAQGWLYRLIPIAKLFPDCPYFIKTDLLSLMGSGHHWLAVEAQHLNEYAVRNRLLSGIPGDNVHIFKVAHTVSPPPCLCFESLALVASH